MTNLEVLILCLNKQQKISVKRLIKNNHCPLGAAKQIIDNQLLFDKLLRYNAISIIRSEKAKGPVIQISYDLAKLLR